jgi:hypothetical protein
MWGDWVEKGKALASKVEAAALDLDKKINQSVGIESAPAPAPVPTSSVDDDDDDDDALNDTWDDNEEENFDGLEDEKQPSLTYPDPENPGYPLPEEEETQEEGWGDNDVEISEGGDVDSQQNKDMSAEESVESEAVETEEPAIVAAPEAPKVTQAPVATVTEEVPVENETATPVDAPEASPTVSVPPEEIPEEDVPQEEDGWAGEDDLGMLDNSEAAEVDEEVPIHSDPESSSSEVIIESHRQKDIDPPAVDSPGGVEVDLQREDGDKQAEDEDKVIVPTPFQEPGSMPIREESSALPVAGESSSANHVANQQNLEQQFEELNYRLKQREDQLLSKTEQLVQMEAIHETEKQELQQKIHNTKEEAKRRIQKAKERVEAVEGRLHAATHMSSSSSEEASKQKEMVEALRAEGAKLAHKQADMERAVRNATGQARELREQLEDEILAKDQALEKLEKLQSEFTTTKEDLASARRGESQADKLEAAARLAREDSENKAATILSLEQLTKEFRFQVKELQDELEEAKKTAVIETQREQKQLRKEHNEGVSDLETKLRTSEQNAAIREDALRHEVNELRKRWQDAVRRADSLSMDVQSSTAPLLRQLEGADRQNRARAAAWAELENSLRAELEENVIANEKLSKERSEWKTKYTRLERAAADRDAELKAAKSGIEDKTYKIKQLEEKLEKMEREGEKMKQEWAEVERLANEGVTRVRSEMTQTVVESEERHQSQLESLLAELREEKEKRIQLERQVEELIEKEGMLVPQAVRGQHALASMDSKPVNLRKSEHQVDILTGALNGLGGDDEADGDDDDDDDDEVSLPHNEGTGTGSYAALAEYASRLKAAEVDRNALRQRLAESEKTREIMIEELAEARNAREKLPLFESRVQELTKDNQEMSLEIHALQEDITDVREMYRTQLNVLLEEKAAGAVDVSMENDERQEPSNETSELNAAGAGDVSQDNNERQEPSNETSEPKATGAVEVSQDNDERQEPSIETSEPIPAS